MKRQQKLVFVWTVVTILSLIINMGLSQYPGPPVPYTDDACLATCGLCNQKVRNINWLRWTCCMWDYGCWANPTQPDYQVSLCDREVVLCYVNVGGGYQYGYYCCEPAVNCSEVDGAPCCQPYHVHSCP